LYRYIKAKAAAEAAAGAGAGGGGGAAGAGPGPGVGPWESSSPPTRGGGVAAPLRVGKPSGANNHGGRSVPPSLAVRGGGGFDDFSSPYDDFSPTGAGSKGRTGTTRTVKRQPLGTRSRKIWVKDGWLFACSVPGTRGVVFDDDAMFTRHDALYFGDDDEHENRRKCTLCKKGTRGVILQYVRTLPPRHVHARSSKEGASTSRIGVVGVKQVALVALGGVVSRFVRRA
jgi:hypothetical protein